MSHITDSMLAEHTAQHPYTDELLKRAIALRVTTIMTWREIANELGVATPAYLSRKVLAEADRLIRVVGKP